MRFLRFSADLKAPTDIIVKGFARVNRQASGRGGRGLLVHGQQLGSLVTLVHVDITASSYQDDRQGTGAGSTQSYCRRLRRCWWKNNNRRDRRDCPSVLLVSLSTSAGSRSLYADSDTAQRSRHFRAHRGMTGSVPLSPVVQRQPHERQ